MRIQAGDWVWYWIHDSEWVPAIIVGVTPKTYSVLPVLYDEGGVYYSITNYLERRVRKDKVVPILAPPADR